MNNFFIITALDFEEDTQKEIDLYLSSMGVAYETKIVKGGVELKCPLTEGLCLNYHLKLATRVLLRLDEFPVYFFNELEKKLKKFELKKYFPEGSSILVKVDAKKSKLGQEKRIFEVFKNVYKKHKLFSKPTEAPESALVLYVDIFKDVCRLSFDTSGEPLYKRSNHKLNAEAPMRETIAHWGMNRMLELVSPWEKPLTFVDPFCGSGTLLLETAQFFQPNKRSFAFESTVKVKEKNQTVKEQAFPFVKYQAMDISSEALEVCKKNLKNSSIFSKTIFKETDSGVVNKNLSEEDVAVGWVYSNLPYGKRVNNQLPENLTEILYQNHKPRIMGLYYPEKLTHSKAIKTIHLKIENGGLKLFFSILVF
jgi:putative N6-adenine-specific DNA methylase